VVRSSFSNASLLPVALAVVEGCSANTYDLGDGEFVGAERWWSSSNTPWALAAVESGHCSVSDEVAFELCKRTEQVEDRVTAENGS
jgi:hypothetical protein